MRSDLLGRHRDVVSALLALPDSPAFGVNASAGVAGIDQLEMGGVSLSLPTDKVRGAVSTRAAPLDRNVVLFLINSGALFSHLCSRRTRRALKFR